MLFDQSIVDSVISQWRRCIQAIMSVYTFGTHLGINSDNICKRVVIQI